MWSTERLMHTNKVCVNKNSTEETINKNCCYQACLAGIFRTAEDFRNFSEKIT